MVVNPIDAIAVTFRNTIQTQNGQWVTSLPYNIQMVESDEVPAGKAIFFVKGQYMACVLYKSCLVLANAGRFFTPYSVVACIGLANGSVEDTDNGRGKCSTQCE